VATDRESGGHSTPMTHPGHHACDSHVHVFDPARFAYAPQRRFTPDTATVAQLQQHLTSTGTPRVVLVQPSVYSHRHHALVDALHTLNSQADLARGVAVLSAQSTTAEVDQLAQAGVVGTRLNLAVNGLCQANVAGQDLQALERRTPAEWHIQLHLPLNALAELAPRLTRTRRVYVVDHFGLPPPGLPPSHPHWQALLQGLASGRMYVKLSAPYLVSGQPAGHADLEPLVRSLVAVAPSHLLWGSNWPHTQGLHRGPDANPMQPEPFRVVDDAHWLRLCQQWAGPHAAALLTHNAASLYRFNM